MDNKSKAQSYVFSHPSSSSVIQVGKYKHYKGNLYEVVGVVLHTETNERLVLYRPLYDLATNNNQELIEFFVRPFDMFFENVVVNGEKVERFKYIGSEDVKGRRKIKVA